MKDDEQADLVTHLEELRTRIIRAALFAVAGASLMWAFYEPLYSFLVRPLREPVKKAGSELVLRGIMDGLLIKCEVALIGGIILAAPLIYAQVWAFIAPGLTRAERRAARFVVPASGVLFLMGVALGYLITGPSITWLLRYNPPGVRGMFTLNDTLLLVLKFYLAFGLSFQLPVVLVILARLGIVDSRLLSRRWREAVVVIMIVAAVITPSWDIFTMSMCALPMALLYLGTVSVIKFIERGDRRRRASEDAPPG